VHSNYLPHTPYRAPPSRQYPPEDYEHVPYMRSPAVTYDRYSPPPHYPQPESSRSRSVFRAARLSYRVLISCPSVPARVQRRSSPSPPPDDHALSTAMPSSDGLDGESNPFPTIEEFLEQLKAKYPKKTFSPLLTYCNLHEYERISELTHFTLETFQDKAGLSEAAARLVHVKLASTVAKIRLSKHRS
jgi:hypothetical protein